MPMSSRPSGPLAIGLCGLGTVGGALFRHLAQAGGGADSAAASFQLQHIGSRSQRQEFDLSSFRVSRDVMAVAADPEVQVLVELIGGCDTARELVLAAIRSGKHVVTANKALLAEHGAEIFAAAAEHGVAVAFEAAVAGAIPIVRGLRSGLAANRVRRIVGIVNGTSNYVLSGMEEGGRTFAQVLAEAGQLGYAEADPVLDLDGTDAAHKLLILSAIAWGLPLRFKEAAICQEGVQQVEERDIACAAELGYRIRPLAIADRTSDSILLRVHPALVPEKHILAGVRGPMNAVFVRGDLAGDTMYCGPGAGGAATVSAILADLIDVAAGTAPVGALQQDTTAVLAAMDTVSCPRYLRLMAADRPGVLSALTGVVSSAGISVATAIQRPDTAQDGSVPLVLLTGEAPERAVLKVLSELAGREDVRGNIVHLRVENFDSTAH